MEDDASFGLMIQTWLKKNGYEAVLASRFEQAKAEISTKAFDLILTDLRLPDGDGIILMTWVRETLKSKVPIIVMTGYAEVQTAVSAMKLGAFDYLKKPINPSVLEETTCHARMSALHLAAANGRIEVGLIFPFLEFFFFCFYIFMVLKKESLMDFSDEVGAFFALGSVGSSRHFESP